MKSFLVGEDYRAAALSSEAGSVHGQPYYVYPKLHQLLLQHPDRSLLYRRSSLTLTLSNSNRFNRAHRSNTVHRVPRTKDPQLSHTGLRRLHRHQFKPTQQLP